ncbi:iron-sulfur cluster binding protein [Oceanicaulis sp. HTCC2633]|uniref:tRNA epoxyqueuosine(34) reductase QueG n=1 Tax=Oceanicaulis sp. HTCC2633 TaxID=314254 RepID=UPI0000669776|nr:tRNA epoxyqueuosine(34) reductase QueG [Oceanicaulis sp. HTCC2633]EAP89709.1 iron-sulfur cluster binding protein [Oceanicaulis sp. HTCC2633]
MSAPEAQAERVKALALEAGFSVVRVTRADEPWEAGARLKEFVGEGRHGDMAWMEDTLDRRSHPTAMWPDAKSAVVVGLDYGPEHDPLAILERRDEAAISVYAQNKDYHDVLKKRLKRFAGAFHRETGAEVKVFVDTAPLMEKPLAHKAGLGWQGKHTNLVSRSHGSWLFLGVMLTAAELEPDTPETDHCGSCRACLDICPTKAFPAPYQIDARRCISYLTIENKGPIPVEFRKPMGNRIYGCDDCLAVCPWNKFAQASAEAAFHPREALTGPKLSELARLDDAAFREFFRGSPIKRIGRDRFVRNVLIALGNSENPALADQAADLLDDPSELVRGAAIWALAQLDPVRFEAEKAKRAGAEASPDVRSEWESV